MNALKDRRSVLLAAAAAASVPAAAVAFTFPTDADWRWQIALKNFEDAQKEHNAACRRFDAVEARYFEQRVAAPVIPDPVYHVVGGKNGTLMMPKLPNNYDEVQAAKVAAKQHEIADRQLKQTLGYHEAVKAADDACDRDTAAMFTMLQTPAPDLNALLRKVEIMIAENCESDDFAVLADDLRRLAL